MRDSGSENKVENVIATQQCYLAAFRHRHTHAGKHAHHIGTQQCCPEASTHTGMQVSIPPHRNTAMLLFKEEMQFSMRRIIPVKKQ